MNTDTVTGAPAGTDELHTQNTALAKLSAATAALAEARSLDEVKHVIDMAAAARVYARAAKLGLEAANHAAEIKVRAERKAGELLQQLERDKPGPRGELNSRAESNSEYRAVLTENDIAPTTAHRWQLVARVPEPVFEDFIDRVKRSQLEITSSSVQRLANPHVRHNSGENEWYTPAEYIEAARRVMGDIDLDPASSAAANQVVAADTFYTIEDDGLSQPWFGRVWLNPPYAAGVVDRFAGRFTDAVYDNEIEQGIVLVNNATDTTWFFMLVAACSAITFTRGRIRFWNSEGTQGAPLQGQAILYAGPNADRFLSEFRRFGWGAPL